MAEDEPQLAYDFEFWFRPLPKTKRQFCEPEVSLVGLAPHELGSCHICVKKCVKTWKARCKLGAEIAGIQTWLKLYTVEKENALHRVQTAVDILVTKGFTVSTVSNLRKANRREREATQRWQGEHDAVTALMQKYQSAVARDEKASERASRCRLLRFRKILISMQKGC